jgi:hypothetical protein
MKWIKSYTKFRLDEKVIFNDNTIKLIIERQLAKAIKTLDVNCKPKDVIEWVKSTLFNTKSDSFLLRLPVEEMKVSGGVGGSFLPKGYHGISTPVDVQHELDSGDRNYYDFMFSIFDSQYGLFSDPLDIKSTDLNFVGKKNRMDFCGLFWLKKVFDKKFGQNQMPYQIVSYMIKTIRNSVAKKIKYTKFIATEEFSDEFMPRVNSEDDKNVEKKPQEPVVENEKLGPGFFKTETPTQVMPDLKQILVKCGGRDLYKKGMSPEEEVKIFAPIVQKKRLAFYNWFVQVVYLNFNKSLDELQDPMIEEYLKGKGIDSGSGKVVYKVGDKVVYLRKDKTMKDWDALGDDDKKNLDKNPASEIIGRGSVSEVEGDNIKIEYNPGEFVTKTSDQIIQKEEAKAEDKEEVATKEEGQGQKTEEGQAEEKVEK